MINLKKTVAALEILNLYIQTLKTRIESLNYEQTIPMNMRKYIASILYCNGRVDITELPQICKAITKRYGKLLEGIEADVDPRISSRLTPCIPNASSVEETLQDILRKNNVAYQYSDQVNPLMLMESQGVPASTPSTSSLTPSAIPPTVSSTAMPPAPPMDPTFPAMNGNAGFTPSAPAPMAPFPPVGGSAFPSAPSPSSFSSPSAAGTSFPPAAPTAPAFPDAPAAPAFPPAAPSFPPTAPTAPSAPSFPPTAPTAPSAPSFPPTAPSAPSAPAFPPQADLPFGNNANVPTLPPDLQTPSVPQMPSVPDTYVNRGGYDVGNPNMMNDLTDRLNNLK